MFMGKVKRVLQVSADPYPFTVPADRLCAKTTSVGHINVAWCPCDNCREPAELFEQILIQRPCRGRMYVCELSSARGLLGFAEASAVLGVHRITLLRWADSKLMKTVRYQKRRLIPMSEVLRLRSKRDKPEMTWR
jgi:hypothetical protein